MASLPDKALMYASIFAYSGDRRGLAGYTIPAEKLSSFQNQGRIPKDSMIQLQGFNAASEEEQRAMYLEKNSKLQELLTVLFSVLENIKGDTDLTFFVLALINGIIEDKRTRVDQIVYLQNSHTKKVDAIGALFRFLQESHISPISNDAAG